MKEDENLESNNTKMPLDEVWNLLQSLHPDIDIESDLKQKMRDIVVKVMSATRSTIELKFLEFTKFKSVQQNKKFFQILGFDIMFDEDLNAWLFEVNSHPSLNICHNAYSSDGTEIEEPSEVDERVKGTIFAETVKILISKQKSDVFELVYDSDEYASEFALYENVFEIYKKISGFKLGASISYSKFRKLSQYLPKSMNDALTIEMIFHKLKYSEASSMSLIIFFTALKTIAMKYEVSMSDLVAEVMQKL
jgi:hypothetical protein